MTSPSQPDLRAIGAVIRDHRERALLTRGAVAIKADLSIHTIKAIELGRARASRMTYLRIGDVIGIEADAMDQLTGTTAGAA